MKTAEQTQREKQIAETILEQLGGRKFIAMTGSNTFFHTEKGLQMKLAGNKSKANFLTINLNEMDTYDVVFEARRMRNFSFEATEKARFEGAYAEDLPGIFKSVTGMDTHL